MTLVSRRTHGVLFLVLALAVLAVSASDASAAEEQKPLVMLIEVEGNQAVPSEEIRAAIKHTQIGAPLNLDAVRADQQAIFDLGYFSEVPPPDLPKTLGGIKVVFRVVEYPPLKEIRLPGLNTMPLDEALAVFTTKPGGVINRNTIVKDLRALFARAQEDYGLILKSPAQRINSDGSVELEIVEMRLRNLSFTGLVKTKEDVVRREISAVEGEVFDAKEFTRDLQDLFMLGYFESIEPKVLETEEPDQLDVRVEFTEAKTGTISLSLAYNTNDRELTGGFQIGDANLFGTGNRLSFAMEMNPDKRNFDLSFTDPWLDSKQTSLTIHLFNDYDASLPARDNNMTPDDTSDDKHVWADETLRGWELTIGRPLSKRLRLSLTGKHEYLDRQFIESWPPPTLGNDPETGEPIPNPDYTAPPANPPLLANGVDTNSLTLSLEYADLTPQKAKYVYVADGIKARLSTEYAGGLLGGDTGFSRYQLETAFFKSFSPRDVLGLRLRGGYVNSIYDPLETANFTIGGAETLRGYDYRDFDCTELALANLEFRHRFNDSIEGVVFYDAYFGANKGKSERASGYGLGFRIYVPYLGQLRFDWGWPTDGGDSQFYFSIGEVF